MSLPKLISTSLNPGMSQQASEARDDDSKAGAGQNRPKQGLDRAPQTSLNMVNSSNFTASHEFKNRHLIFKNPESNTQRPVKKKGVHNRGRSLLDIQREHERESRIGKLQKAVAEQSFRRDYMPSESQFDLSMTASLAKSDLADLLNRSRQQKHSMLHM